MARPNKYRNEGGANVVVVIRSGLLHSNFDIRRNESWQESRRGGGKDP